MYLKVSKFGKVKKFESKIEGLTLILGENNTGKSTVGKVIFSIFKTLNEFEEYNQKEKINHLKKCYNFLLPDILKKVSRESKKLKDIKCKIRSSQNINEIIDCFNQLKKHPKIKKDENILNKLNSALNMLQMLSHPASYANYCFNDVFNKNILNSVEKDCYPLSVELSLNEKAPALFSYNIQNEHQSSCSAMMGLITDLIDDSIFIESPFVIDISNVLKISDYQKAIDDYSIREKHIGEISPMALDLIKKLKSHPKEELLEKFDINKIIKGNFFFDDKSSLFKFKLHDGKELTSHNMPSGIKSFGILKMLIQNDKINKKTILVIDEPENCLHPDWQTKYAELIIDLVIEKEANIIMSTHSPYIIQAIKSIALKKHIWNNDDKIRYIWAENDKEKNWSTLKKLDLTKQEELDVFDRLGNIMIGLI